MKLLIKEKSTWKTSDFSEGTLQIGLQRDQYFHRYYATKKTVINETKL